MIKLSRNTERKQYALPFIAEHLFHSYQYDRLHTLISKNWMQSRVDMNGNYDGFLRDVELAWISTKDISPPNIGLQIRYALIGSCIKSLAFSPPPIFYQLFIEDEIWTLPYATSLAIQIPDLENRCEALLRIACASNISDSEKRYTLLEALNTQWTYDQDQMQEIQIRSIPSFLINSILPEVINKARSIKTESSRQSALSSLLGQLPNEMHQEAFNEAFQLAQSFDSSQKRAKALANMASALSTDSLDEAIDYIETSEEQYSQFICIQKIAGYLPPELHKRAIGIARCIFR